MSKKIMEKRDEGVLAPGGTQTKEYLRQRLDNTIEETRKLFPLNGTKRGREEGSPMNRYAKTHVKKGAEMLYTREDRNSLAAYPIVGR